LSLSHQEIQIKKLHWDSVSPPAEWQLSRKQRIANVGKDLGDKGALVSYWWECKVQPLQKSVWRFLKKLKLELPYDPAVPLLGVFPKETKSACTDMLAYCRTIHNSQVSDQPRCPSVNERIKKMWYMFTIKYYLAIKKNKITSFARKGLELKTIMLSKISQAQKDKYHMLSLMYRL
jgi:hypothetical protein